MDYLKVLYNTMHSDVTARILADDTIPQGITREEFWNRTGKVYAYLKEHGLGTEDFIMICLPRGIQAVIAEFGILRAGAAFVLVEDTYAPERIKWIYEDCHCRLMIDANVWKEILEYEPLEGYAVTDEHDAVLAIYTSGTTGNPKGVLHEYGNLERMVKSVKLDENDRFGITSPMNFIAVFRTLVYGLQLGMFIYIMSYSTVKNPTALMTFLVDNNINAIYMTPSFLKKIGKKLPNVDKVCVGAEPANGLYIEGMQIINHYAMSESGFAICVYKLDKKYDRAPAGVSMFGHEIYLLDEDGKPVPDGEQGEVCFENKYFRGYINLPEETKKAKRGGLFHTGDIGIRNKAGYIEICGRMNDMVKINGNRVEPAEIEAVAVRVLGLKTVAARAIVDANKSYVCLYYLDDVQVDVASAQEKLKEYLPDYMIPAYFMHLDAFPYTNSGKLSRKGLPIPDFSEFHAEYEAPAGEMETMLCKYFAEVLKESKIGRNDDFYQIGGDSLTSIELVDKCGLKDLEVADIFQGRTPKKIAEIYACKRNANSVTDPDAENTVQQKKAHKLSVGQLYMIDYQLYTPKSTMWNLNAMLKFDKSVINMETLTSAVNSVVRGSAALQSVFFFDKHGELCQRYAPEMVDDIVLEKVSEKELAEIRKGLIKPFKIIASPLIRMRLFETEEAGYLFYDIHHTVFDGTSRKLLHKKIMQAYNGEKPASDYYYYVVSEKEKQESTDYYGECKAYFDAKYGNVRWTKHLHFDYETRENKYKGFRVVLDVADDELAKVEKKHQLGRNAFFNAVSLLATAMYEKKSDIMLSWIYNGRSNAQERETLGLLFKNLPIAVRLNRETKVSEFYKDVVNQINEGIAHGCYPYVEKDNNIIEDDVMSVIYQDDIRNFNNIQGLIEQESLENTYKASENVTDLQILNTPDSGVVLFMDVSISRFKEKNILKFAEIFKSVVHTLMEVSEREDITVGAVEDMAYQRMQCR